MASKAQLKASEKYIKGKTDEIKIRVPKGLKAEIHKHAERQNKSLNAYIVGLIDNDMAK
jgi:predicted HicB family RNase H-like nuclease